jgi:CBS domain-containing protein
LTEVAEVMRQRHVGAIVISEQDRPIGIVTDRDLVVRALARALPAGTEVSELMSRDPKVVRIDGRLDEALFAMRSAGVRRLPIVDDKGLFVGMVTLDDLMVLLSAELHCGAEAVLDNRGP